MPKIIIGVHGLGNKPSRETLAKWWKKSIREGLKGIDKYLLPINFKIIYWADVLNEKPLNENITDENDPCFLREKYTPAPEDFKPKSHRFRKKVLDFLEKQMDKIFLNEDLSINYSIISDLIIHRYFKELEIYYSENCIDENNTERPVKDIIRERVLNVLMKYKNCDVLLIGHSMGSILVYDVLTFLSPEINIDTFITMGSPLSQPIIMSKIAAEHKLKFKDKPILKTPPGVMRNWYNFTDLEDKVAINYNVGDDYEANDKGIRAIDKIVSNSYIINNEKNPHKSYGYLRTPETAAVINEFLMHGKSTSQKWVISILNNITKPVNKFGINISKRIKSALKGGKR